MIPRTGAVCNAALGTINPQVMTGCAHDKFTRMQQTDIVEEMYSPKSAAASFVHTLCTTRQKGNLEALMQQVGMTASMPGRDGFHLPPLRMAAQKQCSVTHMICMSCWLGILVAGASILHKALVPGAD